MTESQAKIIQAACFLLDIECEIREGYSGRGMFGQTTCGVVVPSPTSIIQALGFIVNKAIMDRDFVLEDMKRLLEHDATIREEDWDVIKMDNMGLKMIVY